MFKYHRLVSFFFLCHHAAGEQADGKFCLDSDDQCEAVSPVTSKSGDRWRISLKKHGMQMRVEPKNLTKRVGKRTSNWTGVVVSEDIFYGRAVVKIPRHGLLSIETAEPVRLRKELNTFLFEDNLLSKMYNVSGEDAVHLLSLAYPLIAINRDPESVFRDWLDAVQKETLPVLELSKRQRRALKGTTVEGAYHEMKRHWDLIRSTAGNFTFFREAPVAKSEAYWALAVIMRHARIVHPHQDVRGKRLPRMYLFPYVELLQVRLSPDPGVALPFQEEIILDGKREQEMVVQIAKRDIPKGEEIFLWPGRMSNSEVSMRHGITFERNPVGIGRNITQPPNWNDNPSSKVRKEYEKYDCHSLESFELRFSPLGSPMKSFVRCYRISWFLNHGWYSPALTKRRRELDKWPPPSKYGKEDWLSWTQADQEVNRVILEYCRDARNRLKDTITAELAQDFRRSRDPFDRLVWEVRREESRTFKACMKRAQALTI